MKKIIYIIIATSSLALASCDSFLDSDNYTEKDTSNFPKTLTDAEQVLTGIYTNLSYANAAPSSSYFNVAHLSSDDVLGGGGENDKDTQAKDMLLNYGEDMMSYFWEARYQGIFRANTAIETLDNCEGWESDEQKNQFKGEAYFLRAFYYFEMASLFGQVPLVVSTEPVNLPKAEPEEEYAQIASDLKNAIELMYDEAYTSVESGHATKWAAEALMARVFLFYTGYYGETELPLLGDDGTITGTITKSEVIAWLEDCITNSGHSLVGDFRNLWPYTNSYTVEDYDYTKDKSLVWVENSGNVNPEVLFSVKFSNFASWSTTIGYSNQYCLYYGLRGGQALANTFPFGAGWGVGPVNPQLWEDWEAAEPSDVRREASIIDIPSELPSYSYGGWTDFIQETDYWQKKNVPVTAINGSSYVNSYSVLMYGTTDDMQLDNTQDLVLIRLADVYLMHSELTETNTYLNKVRERAGLDDVSYSLTALQNERRWELAFEGLRWNDIRRWGIAADILQDQIGQKIYIKGVESTNKAFGGGYAARYNETGGFFPIPDSEISLSEGVLTQNEGWNTSSSEYSGWK
ncbi:MAG: RagB/SusD family nutrient uptake outer membrane protein [Mangrovibacterium sp.]